MNQEEINARQRAHRRDTNNIDTRRYEKTKRGFLMRAYRNMKSRVTGIQYLKAHLYLGKELLPKEDFYTWALHSETFHRLFKVWEESGYCRKLTPSVDRKDSSVGYDVENMQWLTHSENSAKTSRRL